MSNFLPAAFIDAVILFIFAEALLCISPGPAVLLTISQSMKRGFATGMWGTMGILAANTIYFILSAIGVGALLIASVTLFTIVKYIGAAYLIFMGIQMLIPLVKSWFNKQADDEAGLSEMLAQEPPVSSGSAFTKGFVIQASNPKNLVFFVAFLPQFVIPELATEISLTAQFSVLAIVSVLIEFFVLIAYIGLSVKLAKWVKAKVMLWIDGTAGIFLMLIGVGLATMKKFSAAH
ncbi:MAG: LysE family translocator [Alphaproteobacteria bacterium]|nr:LysE family translocator [Alphaproteobacteria bacterium]